MLKALHAKKFARADWCPALTFRFQEPGSQDSGIQLARASGIARAALVMAVIFQDSIHCTMLYRSTRHGEVEVARYKHSMAFLQIFNVGLTLLVATARSHSFIVEARTIVGGSFVGTPGYPRGYGTG